MNFKLAQALFVVLLIGLPLPARAADVHIPQPRGWVNDFAGVISPEYEQKLNSLIAELESKTSAEIAVVTFPSIAPYTEFEYAQMVFDRWKIGKKGKDNGVLVLVSVRERRWRIHTGYGVEGILPDALCDQIGRNRMVPYLRSGDYSQGLYYGVAAIANVIAKDAGVTLTGLQGVALNRPPPQKVPVVVYFITFFFFLIWNYPWPIFIGLPATMIFGFAMAQISPILSMLIAAGYLGSMLLRYKTWAALPLKGRKPFWQALVFGIFALGGSGTGGGRGGFGGFGGSGGGFSSGGGGGFSGGGGGSSGGGGGGGGF